jgi:NadR type nicotinamide-nucleotide adenylyltransferase
VTSDIGTVCFVGPESTGKTTLARTLAAEFGAVFVPEFGRYYCETFGNECDEADLRAIVAGHAVLAAAALRKAQRLVFLDTDAVMTAVWSDILLGHRPAELDHVADPADLYLLADVDVPFVADSIRYFPDQHVREGFFAACRSELERRKLAYAVLSGGHAERRAAAITAIRARFGDRVMP